MIIFVAGGTGVLGRATLPVLIAAGHTVRSSARGAESAAAIRAIGAEPIALDLYDPQAVRKAIDGCDAIIRITTKIGPISKLRDSKSWTETNRLRTAGAQLLVDAALDAGISTYIHESVAYVYADGGANWLTEDSPTDDAGVSVLRATLEGEQHAARFTEAGRRGIVLRFGGFYAPDAPSTLETIEAMKRRLLPQFGPGTNYFSSVYVPDAGRAVAAAINVPAGIYNVADDEPVTFAEYRNAMAAAFGAPAPFHVPEFMGKLAFGEVWKYFSRSQRLSNAKLKQFSDWKPKVQSVTEGWPLIASELKSKAATA
jgi:nucleoside-diphosphate-sugar epimerase